MHAIRVIDGEKVAYNAGTGVIPRFRGNNLTIKMYDVVLPILSKYDVKNVVLEVMEQNAAAIKSYSKIGFIKTLNLECFKGKVQIENKNKEIVFKKQKNEEILSLQKFWDWLPTWQHDILSIIQSNKYETFCGYLNGSIVCYASIIPKSGRVAQFAVNPKFRKMNVGTSLFNYLSEMTPEGISVINVDGENEGTIQFLCRLGLSNFLRQHKMELKL